MKPMVRIRKLQRKGMDNVWHNDAYAIELDDGSVVFRYSLAWEHMGSHYNRMIQEQHTSLEQLDEVLSGESIRWMPVEVFETDEEATMAALDQECNVPPHIRQTNFIRQRSERRATPQLITLQARVVRGKLQFQAPPASPIQVYGDRIYLEDGRRLRVALIPSAAEQGA
jgi:hypothetical protein